MYDSGRNESWQIFVHACCGPVMRPSIRNLNFQHGALVVCQTLFEYHLWIIANNHGTTLDKLVHPLLQGLIIVGINGISGLQGRVSFQAKAPAAIAGEIRQGVYRASIPPCVSYYYLAQILRSCCWPAPQTSFTSWKFCAMVSRSAKGSRG